MSQELRDALFIPQDHRTNFKNIVAKRSDLLKFGRGRIKYAGAGLTVNYEAGTVLGYATTGADAGFWKPYLSSNTDGSQVAAAILAESAYDVDQYGNGSEIVFLIGGEVFQSLLIGLDSGAISNLGAKSYVEGGAQILSF